MNEEKLFDAYLRGELTAEESSFLIEKLEGDKGFGDRFINYIRATGKLLQCAEKLATTRPRITTTRKKLRTVKKTQSKKTLLPYFMVCSSAAALIFCFFIFSKQQSPASQSFTLSSFDSSSDYYSGYSSEQKTITLKEGEALEFTNDFGSRVVLEGPSVFKIESDFSVFLKSGKASVFVAKGNEGFELRTPISVIKDLGTAFGSEVKNGEMDVHVFDGLVELGKRKQKVKKREAYALNEQEEYRKVLYDESKFLRAIKPLKEHKTILRVGETLYLSPSAGQKSISFEIKAEMFSDFQEADYEVEFYGDGKRLGKVEIDENFKSKKITLSDISGFAELTVFLDGTSEDYAEGKVTLKVLGNNIMPETLVDAESYWYYQQSGSSVSSTWYKSSKVPAGWRRGRSGIGFGRKVNTEVAERDEPLYMYKEFNLGDVPPEGFFILSTLLDDGGIIYLNGKEIHRENCGDPYISADTRTPKRRHDSNSFRTFKLPLSHLKKGKNILTAAIAQYEGSSSDMYFDLKLTLQKD